MTGIHNLSFEDYAAIDAVSNTALGKLAICPAMYRYWKDNPEEDASPALKLGRLAHRAILEPEKFNAEFVSTYAVKPEGMSFATKEGKAWKKTAEEAGLEIVGRAEWEFLSGAAQSIATHPLASVMLGNGKAEQSIVWDYNGIPCKSRPDWVTDGDTVVDLKTARSAEPGAFYWRDIIGRKYYMQMAFYVDACKAAGLPIKHGAIVAIEKHKPHMISCHNISEKLLNKGRELYIRLLGTLVECQRSGVWPGYDPALHEAPAPEDWNRVPDPAWLSEEAA